ncbi:MAG: glycosyl transferase family protein [Parcubacteria group bacterium Athens1014_10]|nr:MAG: glycosyl transferase family protein [Parcubacteria group bacterium Athens1014_10]TSD05548.1 MAG: glycosyl transferase family protein [Parcubacteria group bacterium Athens0714_12]
MKKLISVITPCYNEELNVKICYETVKKIFEEKLPDYDYEHIFCDNSSADSTVQILKEIAGVDKRVKIIVNSRNFGAFHSVFNGILSAKGDAVLAMLAADLQDPPEMILDFIKKWKEGYQIIYGVKEKRQENFIMSSIRKFYYRLLNNLANIPIPLDASEFQFIDKVVVNALRKFDDYYPYVRGMIASCGFKSTGIGYVWKTRKRGVSKSKFYDLIDNGLNGLISFTNIPLRICMFFGFFLSATSILYAFFQLIMTLLWRNEFVPFGIATLTVALFFFAGIQLFFLGVLGEYIGAIHFQVRKKPLVIEKERINFE